ncbi:MAG: translation initiation factor IF-6 [Candidatus Hadarchaeota archaeon]
MPVRKMSIGKIPYLGAFALCTEKFAFFPSGIPFKKEEAEKALGVHVVKGSISQSPILGLLAAGNSNGVVCSDIFEVSDGELVGAGAKVEYLRGNYTAFGNLVLANDFGALVNPDLPEDVMNSIERALGVEVRRGTLARIKNVGAVGVATNKGVMVHPDATEEELKDVEGALHVPASVGTACAGLKFVGLCVVANSKGALAGSTTTGPELGRIESSLGFI